MHGTNVNIKKKKDILVFLTAWPLKMDTTCCPETPVTNHQPRPLNISEVRRPQIYCIVEMLIKTALLYEAVKYIYVHLVSLQHNPNSLHRFEEHLIKNIKSSQPI
jgi:hypothetical protein